jgi:hypothetical protein
MTVRNINSRDKGHRFERDLCKLFREKYPKVCTSRASSRALDECKIDLNNLPFNIQAKNGYENKIFDFKKLKDISYNLLKEKFEGVLLKEYLNKPFLLIHKKKNITTVTLELDSFKKLLDGNKYF